MITSVKQWAKEYERRHFGIARISPGGKKPYYECWTEFSYPAGKFRKGDNIGIQSGGLSKGMVCIDLDTEGAVRLADRFLPHTKMVDGRKGKPKSHRWFSAKNVPPEFTAGPKVAGGIGGPKTRQFCRNEGGGKGPMIAELRGSGAQTVVPPSTWTSQDGRQEMRSWDCFDEPKIVDYLELLDATRKLAKELGFVEKESPQRRGKAGGDEPLPLLPIPPGEAVRQARSYISAIPGAIEGKGGDRVTFRVACLLMVDFGLSHDDAWPLMLEYNARCQPHWTTAELRHKLKRASEVDAPRGEKVRPTDRRIMVSVHRGDEPIYVGLDVDRIGMRSFVNLSPSLWAGIVKIGKSRELVGELTAVDWTSRNVILAPASTIETNRKQVWSEYLLAKLLREQGAFVQSLRPNRSAGRCQALAAVLADAHLVNPPVFAWQAFDLAEKAASRAVELAPTRKALPRKRSSPQLDLAVAFLREKNVISLDKQTVKKARKKGLSEATLKRAMKTLHKPPLSPLIV